MNTGYIRYSSRESIRERLLRYHASHKLQSLGECTVSHAYECRYGELVASLSVNGDKDIVNEINEILLSPVAV